ncbi:MAG: hypothetical protein Q7V05_04345 [Methanoregula sp.]|nr:hypothetical protein [Methanoregula sp.]
MPKATARIQVPDSPRQRASIKPVHSRKERAKNPKSAIQINQITKRTLDQVKEIEHLDTYDDAISFLFRERRKNLPSSAGRFPTGGNFEREEDDPYRIPS